MQIILNLIKYLARTEFLIGQSAIVFHRKNQQKKNSVHGSFNVQYENRFRTKFRLLRKRG